MIAAPEISQRNHVQELTIIQPDDWHLHLRDGPSTATIIEHTAKQFKRAVIMPNLLPPVTTVGAALAYRNRILDLVPDSLNFEPLMTLYLTDETRVADIQQAAESNKVVAIKMYPAGATTNSDSGISNIKRISHVLAVMQEFQLPLLIHGEVTSTDVDVFDREAEFIKEVLNPIVKTFPKLRIVLEHITTQQGIEFVENNDANIAGTLTAHHLLLNRNAIFQGGIRPHHYCLPILKRESHRKVLLKAAISGGEKFFLGTDSAPHTVNRKLSACGCAGIYTAHAAIELYAEAFESENALHKLEAFASLNGPKFYDLPVNKNTITLRKSPWQVDESYAFGGEVVIPFRAEETVQWKMTNNNDK